MSNLTMSFNTTVTVSPTTTDLCAVIKNGYCIPIYGLHDGSFLSIHIPALLCLGISLICAIVVIGYSFYHQPASTFFDWSKSERFVIYMAICDGLYNIIHFADHLNIVIVRKLPTPKSLCDFYGFLMAEFITSQNLMVSIVAINVFVLMYFGKKIDFGRWDHRLLIFIFGAPAISLIIVGALGQLGPNGSFCYFDGINGKDANMFYTTILLSTIFVMNTVLYVLSWYKIYKDTRGISRSVSKSKMATQCAARTMSLFVLAFFVQWWALAVYGIWQWTSDVPQLLVHCVTTFSNSGGILNGIVFIIIMRRKHTRQGGSSRKESDLESKKSVTSRH